MNADPYTPKRNQQSVTKNKQSPCNLSQDNIQVEGKAKNIRRKSNLVTMQNPICLTPKTGSEYRFNFDHSPSNHTGVGNFATFGRSLSPKAETPTKAHARN